MRITGTHMVSPARLFLPLLLESLLSLIPDLRGVGEVPSRVKKRIKGGVRKAEKCVNAKRFKKYAFIRCVFWSEVLIYQPA